MPTSPKDYTRKVMEKYQALRREGKLSPRLNQPTLAGLRDECVDVHRGRYLRKDEQALRAFFRFTGETTLPIKTIEKVDTGIFKALYNFLLGKSSETSHTNMELLAWLIDFEPRPFNRDRVLPGDRSGEGGNQSPGPTPPVGTPVVFTDFDRTEPDADTKKGTKRKPKRLIVMGVGLATIVGVSGFLLSGGLKTNPPTKANKQCMYWSVDRYEQASCTEPLTDRLLVALDTGRLDLRLITKPDTITYQAIGHVWYLKKDNKLDFFTEGGMHPVYLHSKLHPITARIIDSHVLKYNRSVD